MLGNPGRPTVQRPTLTFDELEPEPLDPEWAPALPPSCLRVLSVPKAECPLDCPGQQRDGSCLCDIVRAAVAQDVQWQFEIDREMYWNYVGEPL
jgi:hypothetical protein